MNLTDSLKHVNTVLKGVVGLGLSLAVAFLVVDLLFPGTTNIVDNVARLVSSFMSHGLVGLVALLLFAALFMREQ